jgi:hypothetical protein
VIRRLLAPLTAMVAVALVLLATPALAASGSPSDPANLSDNPVLAANLNGWSINTGGSLLTRVAVGDHVAAGFAARTTSKATTTRVRMPAEPVTGTSPWTFAADVKSTRAGSQASITVEWYAAGGGFIRYDEGGNTPINGTNWTRAFVTAPPPAGATSATSQVNVFGTPKGAIIDVTQHDVRAPVSSPPTTTTTPPSTTTTAPTSTTTPPTTTTTPPPPAASPIFADDFSTGNFAKWDSCQWRNRNDDCKAYNGTSDYMASVVAIDGRPHVARFEVRNGDVPPFGGGERAEIAEPPGMEVVRGDERWITWDMKFDQTWPTPVSWCLVSQWHHNSSSGSPPLTLTMDEGDNIVVRNDNEDLRTTVQPVQRNAWQRWVVHTKFSDDPTVGFVEVWVDGVQKMPKQFRRTMVPGDTGNYFKMGVYRDAAHTATMINYFDNFAIWNAKPPELP